LLAKVMDEFTTAIPQSSYSNPSAISFPQLKTYLDKFQDPRQADSIMKVQQELDETKIILVCCACCYLMPAASNIIPVTAAQDD